MTTQQETPEQLPSIFDSRGQLVELTDEQASRLSEEAYAKYAAVADANDAVLVIEKKIHDTEVELRAASQALRHAEAVVASLPKQNHTDLVREALCAATAGRI